jgi:rod shape-determining protein MreC
MAVLVLAAAALMVADWRYDALASGRAFMAEASTPLYWLANTPTRIWRWFDEVFVSRDRLLEENRQLRAEAVVLRAHAQKLAALAAENVRLRELLSSTAPVEENVLVAEIIGVSPDVGDQTVMIDKGALQGLHEGQAVIDAHGLFGQIVEVSRRNARVLLVTDAMHAVPAEVLRNGIRVLAEGTGRIDMLDINHVAATMDVREGDLLVSSGLGQRFPRGYPVGVVESVKSDPSRPFSQVRARPSAQLSRSRYVVVVMLGGAPSVAAGASP